MSGGGTAGHVFPAVAVAERLRAAGHDVRFVGSAEGQEAALVPAAGFPFVPVRVASAQTRFSRAHREGALAVAHRRPRRPAAGAVVRRGRRHRWVRERPGDPRRSPHAHADRRDRAERGAGGGESTGGALGARGGHHLRGDGRSAARRHAHRAHRQSDPPVRSQRSPRAREERRAEALRVFDLEGGRRTVSVFGGSQGARALDRTVAAAIGELRDRGDLQLLVATGPAHVEEVAPAARASGDLLVRVVGFIDRIDLALAATDLAVARAGSGTLAELSACGVPSILVPYPHATEHHQDANAREVERAGGAEVVLEQALDPAVLAVRISALMADDVRRGRMRRRDAAVGATRCRRAHRCARAWRRRRERLPAAGGQHPHPAGAVPRRRRLGAHDRGGRGRHAQPRPSAACARHRRARVRHEGVEGARRARRRGRRGLGGPRSGSPRVPRRRDHLERDRRGGPGAACRPRPRGAGLGPAAGPRGARGRSSLDRRRRHPRQDHDDLDDRRPARTRRARPELPDRRRHERERQRRAQRRRRSVPVRGRRERRVLPLGATAHRGRDERRRRPRRLLPRRSRRDRGGLRVVRPRVRARSWPAATTPGCGRCSPTRARRPCGTASTRATTWSSRSTPSGPTVPSAGSATRPAPRPPCACGSMVHTTC